ncbi:MAG: hypothetical protein LBI53_06280 [Candidatus Peribacteria bacterium]|jgi:hypothetical protein|nr:hypothetical protein [Candidatus Peribacteria bacterium]
MKALKEKHLLRLITTNKSTGTDPDHMSACLGSLAETFPSEEELKKEFSEKELQKVKDSYGTLLVVNSWKNKDTKPIIEQFKRIFGDDEKYSKLKKIVEETLREMNKYGTINKDNNSFVKEIFSNTMESIVAQEKYEKEKKNYERKAALAYTIATGRKQYRVEKKRNYKRTLGKLS